MNTRLASGILTFCTLFSVADVATASWRDPHYTLPDYLDGYRWTCQAQNVEDAPDETPEGYIKYRTLYWWDCDSADERAQGFPPNPKDYIGNHFGPDCQLFKVKRCSTRRDETWGFGLFGSINTYCKMEAWWYCPDPNFKETANEPMFPNEQQLEMTIVDVSTENSFEPSFPEGVVLHEHNIEWDPELWCQLNEGSDIPIPPLPGRPGAQICEKIQEITEGDDCDAVYQQCRAYLDPLWEAMYQECIELAENIGDEIRCTMDRSAYYYCDGLRDACEAANPVSCNGIEEGTNTSTSWQCEYGEYCSLSDGGCCEDCGGWGCPQGTCPYDSGAVGQCWIGGFVDAANHCES